MLGQFSSYPVPNNKTLVLESDLWCCSLIAPYKQTIEIELTATARLDIVITPEFATIQLVDTSIATKTPVIASLEPETQKAVFRRVKKT